jgi:glycosyltransferase involved in cell wall biosynthesis
MKVLQVNNQLLLGGAETVMHQLHNGLLVHGDQSRMCVALGAGYPHDVVPFYPRILSRFYHSRFHDFTERCFPRRTWTDRSFRKLARSDADIIHIHNFHGNYASIASLGRVAASKKVVWTFHALWGVTGGCDHPRECIRYQERCGACPQVGQWPVGAEDHTAEQLAEKLALLSGLPLHVVAPSQWLADIVSASQVGREWKIHTIPNGVDPAQFAPAERKSEKISILIVNRDFADSRKGYPMVKQALLMVEPAGIRVVIAGGNSQSAAAELGRRFDCRNAGYVRDRETLAKLYAEADIFLFASEVENFPCVILEAMASECCVVATPSGGVVEQVQDRTSGLLACAISGEALGEALRVALGDEELRIRLGRAARQRVIENFTEERMIARYLELYRDVIREN